MLGFNQFQMVNIQRLHLHPTNYLSTLETVAYFSVLVVFPKLNWVITRSKVMTPTLTQTITLEQIDKKQKICSKPKVMSQEPKRIYKIESIGK